MLKKSYLYITAVLCIIGFSLAIIGVTIFMTFKNSRDLILILEDSIRSELISSSMAAREMLDIDRFEAYNTPEDIANDRAAYDETLGRLRDLKNAIGAEYIYALKDIGGRYFFIFDTDEEIETLFDEYEIFPVHEAAFAGMEAAGVMNVSDEYGDFNTGAVPIWKNGKVIGIISTDTMDAYIRKGNSAADRNAVFLTVTLILTIGAMAVILSLLARNVHKIQDKLFKMANYDVLTGLPNRQYLMSYLPKTAEKAIKKQMPFAFMLIDLDNFKQVNDGAGHDAGDELLCRFAKYLNNVHENSKSFRPPAGALNVSARIGGDEFVQIIPGVATIEEAHNVAKKVLENFGAHFNDRFVTKYQVGLSIGVALYPYHTENFNVLIKYADLAMYHAKKNGKNAYSVYSDEMSVMDAEERADRPGHDRRANRG